MTVSESIALFFWSMTVGSIAANVVMWMGDGPPLGGLLVLAFLGSFAMIATGVALS